MKIGPVIAVSCLVACLASAPAGAQAVLHPNQIVGSVRLTSGNPTIQSIIDSPFNGSCRLYAQTVGPPPYLFANTTLFVSDRQAPAYELTVESSPTGIAYKLTATLSANDGEEYYRFAEVFPPPVLEEPAPDVRLDIAECAGLFRVQLPAGATSLTIEAWRDGEGSVDDGSYPEFSRSCVPGSDAWLLVHGDGHLYHVRVRYAYGTDPEVDTLQFEQWFVLEIDCDEIVDLDCSGPGGGGTGGGFELGAAHGVFDYVGEHELPVTLPEVCSFVWAQDGPWGNGREKTLGDDPSSGAFVLPNLMPSIVTNPPTSYWLQARALLRGGQDRQRVTTPRIPLFIGDGADVDLGDRLVLQPGYVDGRVDLQGPASDDPLLDHLIGPSAAPGGYLWLWGTSTVPPDGSCGSDGAETSSAFPGSFDRASASFTGDAQAVVAGLGSLPAAWNAERLSLYIALNPDPARPPDEVDCRTFVYDTRASNIVVAPGEHVTMDRDYCMSQVNVLFLTTAGVMCCPTVGIQAYQSGFEGVDYRGDESSYHVDCFADGTPKRRQDAVPTGRVAIGVPMGDYVMRPTFGAVNPTNGSVSFTDARPFALRVGCREVIDVYPEIGISISANAVPPCAEAGEILVNGSVRSDERVASITWQLAGGAPNIVCTNCGTSPSYSAPVVLADGDNTIILSATDVAGRTASIIVYTRWAPEPSALDRRPGSTPMLVRKEGLRGLTITWEPTVGANLYRGTIASLHRAQYNHQTLGACNIDDGTFSFPNDEGSWYYLANGSSMWGDGSLGRDSFGRERPPATPRCH